MKWSVTRLYKDSNYWEDLRLTITADSPDEVIEILRMAGYEEEEIVSINPNYHTVTVCF